MSFFYLVVCTTRAVQVYQQHIFRGSTRPPQGLFSTTAETRFLLQTKV